MLERLKKIDLRKAWKSEDKEFTHWLAGEENLELLGDTIGIELESVSYTHLTLPTILLV